MLALSDILEMVYSEKDGERMLAKGGLLLSSFVDFC